MLLIKLKVYDDNTKDSLYYYYLFKPRIIVDQRLSRTNLELLNTHKYKKPYSPIDVIKESSY